MYNYPYARPGLFSRLFNISKGFSWGGFLDGTQKTLGVINQAIPLVNQVKPIFNNAKTMFMIADEMRKPSESTSSNVNSNVSVNNNVSFNNTAVNSSTNRPIFYM